MTPLFRGNRRREQAVQPISQVKLGDQFPQAFLREPVDLGADNIFLLIYMKQLVFIDLRGESGSHLLDARLGKVPVRRV